MDENAGEILLVEDNVDDVELTLIALQKSNLSNRVTVVNDGQEALDYIFSKGVYADRNRNQFPNVIFLDLNLPKIGGLDVLKAIKGDERTREIPVVAMTSSQQEVDIVESYKLGVNSYIAKPIDFGNFTDTVAKLGYYWLMLNKSPFNL